MIITTRELTGHGTVSWSKLAAVICLAALTGACSSLGGEGLTDLVYATPTQEAPTSATAAPQNELEQATEYWRKEYTKAPHKVENAIAYAKNLRAMGRRQEAYGVLQSAAQIHNTNRELAAEYGRLALELDQTTLAAQLLEYADDPSRPDWRIISARGAALAKLSRYKEAVAQLERAQMLAPDQPAVKNNLALAYAMSGEAPRGEQLLREAIAADPSNTKARQNLAIVLGLQGKYDEATQVGATALSADDARQNTQILRQIVKLDPKRSEPSASVHLTAGPSGASATSGWDATVVNAIATP